MLGLALGLAIIYDDKFLQPVSDVADVHPKKIACLDLVSGSRCEHQPVVLLEPMATAESRPLIVSKRESSERLGLCCAISAVALLGVVGGEGVANAASPASSAPLSSLAAAAASDSPKTVVLDPSTGAIVSVSDFHGAATAGVGSGACDSSDTYWSAYRRLKQTTSFPAQAHTQAAGRIWESPTRRI